MIRRTRWTALLSAAVLLSVLASPVTSRSDGKRPAIDVTNTSVGRAKAVEAAARNKSNGVDSSASDLIVYEIAPREYFIAPEGTQVLSVETVVGADGTVGTRVDAAPPADAAFVDPKAGQVVAAAASAWTLVSSFCWNRTWYDGGAVWMDTCYHKHKLTNDGSGTVDYFEMHMFATGASKVGLKEKLKSMSIEAWRASGSPAQTWFDWSPRSDSNRNCQSITVGVTQPIPMAYSHQQCDEWDITKFADAGHFRNTWKAPLLLEPYASEREVAFSVAVKVAQGQTAQWVFSWVGRKV
jgi:hypothetical protein